uniref:Uncharacterized protein n=1 Tax=Noctiluca scintillans TaxID=2966 RepID=A0A7S1AZT1_NOCSC
MGTDGDSPNKEAGRPLSASGSSAQCSEGPPLLDAFAELSRKVVQLTKVIVFLHIRCDGHEGRLAALRKTCEEEVRQIANAAELRVETQRAHMSAASHRREGQLSAVEKQQTRLADDAGWAVSRFREDAGRAADASRSCFWDLEARCVSASQDANQKLERLVIHLAQSSTRAQTDERWLMRQLKAETRAERRLLDEEFEVESARLKLGHTEHVEELRAAHQEVVEALRQANKEHRMEVHTESEQATAATLERQECSFRGDREQLESQADSTRQELVAAQIASDAAKEETATRQRVLDDMSKDLQDRKRRAHALSKEADITHDRRLKAEKELQDSRRQKTSISRALGAAAAAPQTERAVAVLAEDVREAKSKLDVLRAARDRGQRLLEDQRCMVIERKELSERLGRDLIEERKRSDELQRTLFRLEQNS